MGVQDYILELSGGNPGAIRVCVELFNGYGLSVLEGLLLLNLRGSAIWMLYKDECHEDIDVTYKSIVYRIEQKLSGETN